MRTDREQVLEKGNIRASEGNLHEHHRLLEPGGGGGGRGRAQRAREQQGWKGA